jgi:hypothetical protein
MSELTPDERLAGRWFRDANQLALHRLNELDPPGLAGQPLYVLPLWRVVRHDCIARSGASTGIALKEKRVESPELWLCGCGDILPADRRGGHRHCGEGRVLAAGGRFVFVFKEGRCGWPGCGLTARSREGRVLVQDDSPGRGGQTPAHPGNTRVPGP